MAKLPIIAVRRAACFNIASRISPSLRSGLLDVAKLAASPCLGQHRHYNGDHLSSVPIARTSQSLTTRLSRPAELVSLINSRLFHTTGRCFAEPKENHKVLNHGNHNAQSSGSSASSFTPKLDAIRQPTKVLTKKVRSSITSLTPREKIYNIPNFLTATRLFAAPVIGYLVLHGQHKYALGLFAYAGITDMVDGWMARRFMLQTVVGSVIDPMADKFLMTVLTVTLTMKGLLPAYLAVLILGRDVSLAVAALYYRYASLPAPKTMKRYWDFSLPSAEVHPTTMSKFNTFLQLLLIGATLAFPVLTADNHHLGIMHDLGLENVSLDSLMTYFQWTVTATTVWSGLSYAYLKNAVKILGKDEALKAKQGRRGRAIIGVTFGSVVAAAAWLALTGRENTVSDSEERAD